MVSDNASAVNGTPGFALAQRATTALAKRETLKENYQIKRAYMLTTINGFNSRIASLITGNIDEAEYIAAKAELRVISQEFYMLISQTIQ